MVKAVAEERGWPHHKARQIGVVTLFASAGYLVSRQRRKQISAVDKAEALLEAPA